MEAEAGAQDEPGLPPAMPTGCRGAQGEAGGIDAMYGGQERVPRTQRGTLGSWGTAEAPARGLPSCRQRLRTPSGGQLCPPPPPGPVGLE